jgi:uncharacterized protein (DUF58 family)
MLNTLRSLIRQRITQWMFQHREPEVGEVFLHQRRVYIVPTRPGLAFFVMLAVLFLGSINYNLSLGFALTFLIAGCAVIDMHLTFRNLAHLHLQSGRAHPVFAGDEAQFELHLINRRKYDRYAIWLGFIGEHLPELEQATDISGNSTRTVTLGVTTTKRGWLAAPRIRLQTRFPLGLLRAWSYWQPDASILVYPRPEDNAPPLPKTGSGHEDGSGYTGDDDFAGIRAYQSGDSIKHLAWRQIARMDLDYGGTLVTKHFEGGDAEELCIDSTRLPHAMGLEQKLSRMTRWVLEAESQGLSYAFRLDATAFPASSGSVHQEACLRALALYRQAS